MTSRLAERALARSFCSTRVAPRLQGARLLIAMAPRFTSRRKCSTNPWVHIMTNERSLSSTSPKSDSPGQSNNKQAKMSANGGQGDKAHQYQSSDRTDREEDQWKFRVPYKIHEAGNFEVKWRGKCHCGKVQYQLSRDKPLASKYCHCTTCQRLHGVSALCRAHFHEVPWSGGGRHVADRPAAPTGSLPMGRHLPEGRYQFHERCA